MKAKRNLIWFALGLVAIAAFIALTPSRPNEPYSRSLKFLKGAQVWQGSKPTDGSPPIKSPGLRSESFILARNVRYVIQDIQKELGPHIRHSSPTPFYALTARYQIHDGPGNRLVGVEVRCISRVNTMVIVQEIPYPTLLDRIKIWFHAVISRRSNPHT